MSNRVVIAAFIVAGCVSALAQTDMAPLGPFRSGGGIPGGATTTLQYNNAGAFGGISGFTTDGANAINGGAGTSVVADNFQVQNRSASCTGYSVFLFDASGSDQFGICAGGTVHALWTTSAANPLNYNANAERSSQLINANAGANAVVGEVWRNSTSGAGADYAWAKLNGGGNSGGTNGANAFNIENTADLWLRTNGANFFGIASGAVTANAIAPTQVASGVVGNSFSISASNATAGASNAGGVAGGPISLTAGNAARFTSGNAAGGAIGLTGGTSIGAAAGGAINVTGGTSDTIANSSGGAVVIAGGAGTGTANTIAGGAVSATSGVGAPSNSSGGTAGASGVHTVSTAAGGAATNNGGGTGGASGAITVSTGAGGSATGAGGTRNGANSGAILLSTGAAGTGASANGTIGTITLAPGGTNGLVVTAASLVRLPSITNDGGLTDSSVCQDTTNHELHSGSGAAGICLGTSSMRYKHDIAALHPGLKEIMRLDAVSYRLNADKGGDGKILYGFTAEQMASVLPLLVENDEQGRPNRADYMGVVPVLVRAIQQLEKRVAELEARK